MNNSWIFAVDELLPISVRAHWIQNFYNPFVSYFQREVALYTSTKNGMIEGVQLGSFVLPHRWTFATLKACVHDFLASSLQSLRQDIKIDRIYYKKSGKSKHVVAVNGDMDISALLDEYPLTFACGKRKTGIRCKIIMAVDWSHVKRHDGKWAADRSLFKLIFCVLNRFLFLFWYRL